MSEENIQSPKTSRKSASPKAKRPVERPDVEKLTMRLVLKLGGSIDAARQALEELRENPAMNYAIEVGGVEQGLTALAELEKQL